MSNKQASPSPLEQLKINLLSGAISSSVCAGAFNPWDRALYLSVKNKRPFLSVDNFKAPYQGFSQAVLQRIYVGSLYFILQGQMKDNVYPILRMKFGLYEPLSQLLVGTSAGAITAVMSNGIAAVKYHSWGRDNRTFLVSARRLWQRGGFPPFFRGTSATVDRDMTFGGSYELLRHLFRLAAVDNTNLEFVANCLAALFSTALSAPFNYARTIQYATAPDKPAPSVREALHHLNEESRAHKGVERFSFFQQRFRIGWGSARVAVGMAVGQAAFDHTRAQVTALTQKDFGR